MKSNTGMRYGALAVAGLCLLLGSVTSAAKDHKTLICHKPGERGQRILNVNLDKDGAKHESHGDEIPLKECDIPGDEKNNDCDSMTDDDDGAPGGFCDDGMLITADSCDSNGECANVLFCGNAQVDPGEECDDGNNVDGDGCSADCLTEVSAVGNVFVTSYTYTGDLVQEAIDHAAGEPVQEGLASADALCNYHRDEEGSVVDTSINYAAWLSDSNNNARDRIGEGPYILPDGTVVADDKADLIDGAMSRPAIDLDETGVILPNGTNGVWTGTIQDGTRSELNCINWDPDVLGQVGLIGLAGEGFVTTLWTQFTQQQCLNNRFRLYCFPAANGD